MIKLGNDSDDKRHITVDYASTRSVDEDFIDGTIEVYCNTEEDYNLIKEFIDNQIEIAKEDNKKKDDKEALAYTE